MLVAAAPDDAPWRMIVDLVQEGHITLASHDDEPLPAEWRHLPEVIVTSLGRFSVYLIHVAVVRCGETRLVITEPGAAATVQRRVYARVFSPVPATFTLLDDGSGAWLPFAGEVRDLGGGGCSILSDQTPDAGATIAASFVVDDGGPVVILGRVLPRDPVPAIGKPMTRLEFALIREADRDRILRFVLLALAGRRKAEREAGARTLPAH